MHMWRHCFISEYYFFRNIRFCVTSKCLNCSFNSCSLERLLVFVSKQVIYYSVDDKEFLGVNSSEKGK